MIPPVDSIATPRCVGKDEQENRDSELDDLGLNGVMKENRKGKFPPGQCPCCGRWRSDSQNAQRKTMT